MACLTAQIFVCITLRLCNDHLNKKNKKVVRSMSEEEQSMMKEKLAFVDETNRKNTLLVCAPTDNCSEI